MDLPTMITNIKRNIKKRKRRQRMGERINRLQEKVNILERKCEALERKRDSQIVLSEDSISSICKSIEIIKERDNKQAVVNLDKVIKIVEIALTLISVIISAWAVYVTRNVANDQIQVAKMTEKVIISCEYFSDETELTIRKENGRYEYVSVNYLPVFFTSFAIETDDGNFQVPKNPIPINVNVDWQRENANQSSQTILLRDIDEWNREYYPKMKTITDYYNGKKASVIQLGYIIKIEYYDAINEELCAKYYKLLTDVYSESKTNMSIGTVSRYDTYEIKEIYEDEAMWIFDNRCEISIVNENTWPTDFLQKYIE